MIELICIKSHSMFKSNTIYYGKKIFNNKQTYSNGEWYYYEYLIDSVVGEPGLFYTKQEWRDLQLNKVLC